MPFPKNLRHLVLAPALVACAASGARPQPDLRDVPTTPDASDVVRVDAADDARPDLPAARDGDVADGADASVPAPLPASLAIRDRAVVAWVDAPVGEARWIEESLAPIPYRAGDREVGPRRLVLATGQSPPRVVFDPAPAERLLAAVGHPSGEWSAVLATADLGVALVRGARDGSVRARVPLDDPALAADTDAWLGATPPTRLALPLRGEDSPRLAADGEDVVVTLTNAWDAALAYRWRWSEGRWARGPRTLLAPAAPLPVFIPDTASYDVFDAVVNPWSTLVCVDGGGAAHVALWVDSTRLRAINRVFGTSLTLRTEGPPTVERPSDLLVWTVGRDGRRSAARVVGVANVDDEAYAIACASGRVALVGRHRREVGRDNTEIHAMLAMLPAGDGAASVRSFDGEANAIAQAVTFVGDEVWVGGTEAWSQNPIGVSVSGPGRPFLLRWSGRADQAPTRVSPPTVEGHGELRALRHAPRALRLGGVANGPVSHTWDSNRAGLRGDGWIRVLPLP